MVEALGVEGDRIGAVGSEAEVQRWAGDGARVVELDGRALLPGFIDAHGHYPGAGVYAFAADLNAPPIGTVRSLDDLVARLREQAAETEPGAWVIGMSYDDTLLAESRHPTREDLDRVSTEHPVGVVHVSGHLAAVNGRGLELLGIGRDSADPEGGRIRRDRTASRPACSKRPPWTPVMVHVMQPGPARQPRDRRGGEPSLLWPRASRRRRSGYATEELAGLVWLSRLGRIPLRLVIWPGVEWTDAVLSGEASLPRTNPLWVRFGAVKLISDGSIQGYTAYLREPYFVPPGDGPGGARLSPLPEGGARRARGDLSRGRVPGGDPRATATPPSTTRSTRSRPRRPATRSSTRGPIDRPRADDAPRPARAHEALCA